MASNSNRSTDADRSVLSSTSLDISTAPNDGAQSSEEITLPSFTRRKRDVKALVAEVRRNRKGKLQLRSASSVETIAAFAALSREELEEALAETELTIKEPHLKLTLINALLGQIAETDPLGALAYIANHLDTLGKFGQSAPGTVMSTWAGNDPDAVWEYYQKLKNNGDYLLSTNTDQAVERSLALSHLFSAMGMSDLNKALDRLGMLEAGDLDGDKGAAIRGLVQGVYWDDSRREALLAATENMEGYEGQLIRSQILSHWAHDDDGAAVEWVLALPENESAELIEPATRSLMGKNPQRGAEILIDIATERELPDAYATVVERWAWKDPDAAGKWLNQQPQGPELDKARKRFSSSIVLDDPEGAMVWAMTIVSPEAKIEAIREVYQQWSQLDAGAANATLENAELTGDEHRIVRTPD